MQIIDPAVEMTLDFDPLDDTKTVPEDQFPLIAVGKIVLNKNPEDYFAEVEQSAFAPSVIVPGIELSADKMLQGRAFSYPDTQRYRVGANYLQLPVNCPYGPCRQQPAKRVHELPGESESDQIRAGQPAGGAGGGAEA